VTAAPRHQGEEEEQEELSLEDVLNNFDDNNGDGGGDDYDYYETENIAEEVAFAEEDVWATISNKK